MTQEISSLMDGELEPHEAERVIRSCCASSEAAEKWQAYNLIGDVLRGGKPHPTNTAERVHRALAAEPTIIARPKRVYESTFGRVALAAAASVATIGVVGWMGNQASPVPAPAMVARAPGALQPIAMAQAADIQDYVVAHRQLPSAELFRAVANTRPAPASAAR
jgi:sigma-E factor negative regulatory protein RseA